MFSSTSHYTWNKFQVIKYLNVQSKIGRNIMIITGICESVENSAYTGCPKAQSRSCKQFGIIASNIKYTSLCNNNFPSKNPTRI